MRLPPVRRTLRRVGRLLRRRFARPSEAPPAALSGAPVAHGHPEAAVHFAKARSFSGSPPPGWIVDFMGIRTQWKFVDGHWPHTAEVVSQMWQNLPCPEVNGLEYFEWIDLLHAVQTARDRFVMVELGAGYGRWAVRAARLVERLNPMPYTLVGVEAEPTHFVWMREHLVDNDVDPDAHHLVSAPVAASRAPVHFLVGSAATCYGQAIVNAPVAQDGLQTESMGGVTLGEILEPYAKVDLIDLDIQGAELDVLSAAIHVLDAKCKRLQVGTHGAAIEAGLRELFAGHGWQLLQDYPCGSKIYVPKLAKELDVGDGVQTWVNPKLVEHHAVFSGVAGWSGTKPKGFGVDYLGCLYRLKYVEGAWPEPNDREMTFPPFPPPPFDEEYFEWIDLLETIKLASERYVIVELGAGYGRWCVRAAKALRRLNPIPFALVAVEAEPTHFEWIAEHFRDNAVDPSEHELLPTAVSCTSGTIAFMVGQPSACYGQSISGRASERGSGRNRAPADTSAMAEMEEMEVPAAPLSEILARHARVDLLDCDIQGHEAEVFTCSLPELREKVRRIHVATHSAEIEDQLRKLFGDDGWICLNDFGCGGVRATPFGLISFQDGVQTWVNPRLA